MLLKNESNTKDLALKTINISKKENLVICLNGDLGSGKTTFARYFIQSYFKTHKITDIPSPTFTLLQVYEFHKKKINHYDFYRLKSQEELIELNFSESILDDVCLIEWSNKFQNVLPRTRLEIEFKIISKNSRSVSLNFFGDLKKYGQKI